MNASDVMVRDVVTVGPEEPVSKAVQLERSASFRPAASVLKLISSSQPISRLTGTQGGVKVTLIRRVDESILEALLNRHPLDDGLSEAEIAAVDDFGNANLSRMQFCICQLPPCLKLSIFAANIAR